MTMWTAFSRELDLWHDAGRVATFWWRDDDATIPSPALDRLALVADGRPVSIAVIPEPAEPSLFEWLSNHHNLAPAQHGWSHRNFATQGKKCEFGIDRKLTEALADIASGWQKLSHLAEAHSINLDPLFVPPWNRITPAIADQVPEQGPAIVSLYGARKPEDSSRRLNTHFDPADWRQDAQYLGDEKTLSPALNHLMAKRQGNPVIDTEEPTGLLTHHLRHDAESWDFIARFADMISEHPGSQWLSFGDRDARVVA